ncbi:MAG: RluA family pseudouridine synthase, partial [Candidatus Sericytochromatia bacterium]
HRIDKDTSGLVVFAKHPLAHQRLDKQLQARAIDRRYLALVWGRVEGEGGEVSLPIGLVEGHPVAREVQEGGQAATTTYEVVERFPEATLVRLKLGTGRTHQIRVHMAAIGHPLVGDGLYAEGRPGLLGRQALHAATIGFGQPMSGERLAFEAPLPEDFTSLLAHLRSA